ncbi:MAG TPA: hypothetical protein VGA01_20095 [Candidatus Binatia bacterium]
MAPENIVDIIDIYVVIHDDDISGKFTQTDDLKVIDETYDFYAPYWVTSLALRPEQFQTWFSYLDDKEYPLAKKTEPKDFYDNSFVENLEKSGFFQKISQARQTK